MADTAVEKGTEQKPPAEHIETGAWTAGGNNAPDHGRGHHPGEVPGAFGNVVIAGAAEAKPVGPIVGRNFDAGRVAADINEALHPGFFSWQSGPDNGRVWKDLLNLSPDEFTAVEKEFNTKYAPDGKPILFGGSEPWTLEKDLKLQLGPDADRFKMLIESKRHNDVPPENRVNGEAVLKAGSPLKVGEMNRVNLPDGRMYDVYIPKNCDNRAPAMVAMHGAAGGDSLGLMAQESGLTADAERTGQMVIFAYPKPRDFDSAFGKVQGVAWNAPDRLNLPSAKDSVTDDRKYLDSVLDDMATKTQMSPKVGLYGFSDGGRFAQVYAADRPERVAAIVSADGTWMKGDKPTTNPVPAMIIFGDRDKTLPVDGGKGGVSWMMDKILGTNLDQSDPRRQVDNLVDANSCKGAVSDNQGDVTMTTHTGCSQPLVEYTLKHGHHAINDYKNDGSRFVQWLLGSPDRTKDFSTKSAQFIRDNIVRDLSVSRVAKVPQVPPTP